jgi:hypothetical protein
VFRDTSNVRAASSACGISRMTAYRLRDRDPEFAREWQEAEDDACDLLEAVARERASNGSDTLLIFLLKAHRPAKYRETTRHDVVFGRMSDDELDAYIALRLAESQSGSEDRSGPPPLTDGSDGDDL